MSVANTEAVFYRRFAGYPQPELPEGWWWGVVIVVGDASGGTANLSLALAPISGALNSRIFNLEQISISMGSSTPVDVRLQGSNLVGPGGATLTHDVALELLSAGSASVVRGSDLDMLPLFLGSANDRAQQAAISAVLNNVDGVTFAFEAEGYWWGPRSILADGGPQRPQRSIYG